MYVDYMQGKAKWKRISVKDLPEAKGKVDFCCSWQIYHHKEMGEHGSKFGNLVFDLDHTDPEIAQVDTKRLFDLFLDSGVNPKNIRVKFSGKKGFHLEIDYRSYMEKPEHKLELIYKEAYRQLKEKFTTIDPSMYKIRALLRQPNSIHPLSNLFSIPVTREDLNLKLDEIKKMARQHRELEYEFVPDPVMKKLFNGMKENFYLSVTEYEKRTTRIKEYTGKIPPCIDNALHNLRGMRSNRNNTIYILACSMAPFLTQEEIEEKIHKFCINNDYNFYKDALPTIRSAIKKTDNYLSCSQMESFCDKIACESMSHPEDSKDHLMVNEHFVVKSQTDAIIDVEQKIKSGEYDRALNTGIPALDRLTILAKDHVTVICGNSNEGKSSLVTTIISNNPNKKFVYLSLEEGIDRASLRMNKANVFDDRVTLVESKLSKITPDLIRSLIKVHPCDAIFIDQLINMDSSKIKESERLKYKEIMESSRKIARETNTPFFLIHQLNREAKFALEPRKEHLAEGADIERLAYDVWIVYRRHSEILGDKLNLIKIDKTKTNRDDIKIPVKYCFIKGTFVAYDEIVPDELFKEFNICKDMYNTGKASDFYCIKKQF